jgi:hypothetical protein
MRPLRRLIHAAKMVWRNRKRYAFLSVTIVLSFSLLLGYLLYTDGKNYNTYKSVFARDRSIVITSCSSPGTAFWDLFSGKLSEIPDTHCYSLLIGQLNYGNCVVKANQPGHWVDDTVTLYALPGQVFGLYDGLGAPLKIEWREGETREGVRLAPGEALANDALLAMLPEGTAEFRKTLLSPGGDRKRCDVELKLVGTVKSNEASAEYYSERPALYVSRAEWNPVDQPDLWWTQSIVVHSSQPEKVYNLAKNLNPDGWEPQAVYRDQNEALKKQRQDARIKAILTVGLFLLLGINLYSSFSNALNERKFEIGVKRAIGAGAPQIVGQFTLESLLVLLGDLALSVALVTGAGIAYKFFIERTPDDLGRFHVFTLYITPWSVAMFAVCALSLTVVFSLIFSYQATKVQVIDYLKGE